MNHSNATQLAKLAILLVEDNPADVRLIKEALAQSLLTSYDVVSVDRLADALKCLDEQLFDVVLLDLTLPDGHEIAALQQAHQHAPDIPIIVFTSVDNEHLVLRLAQTGAQDYLAKNQLSPRLLERAIHYAVERRRLLLEVERGRQHEQQEREMRSLDRLSGANSASAITAQMFGLAPLRESAPNIFYELVLQYGNLLDLCLEQRAYRVEYNVNERLRFMAERIGFLNAGPRDVIEIHTTALRQKTEGASAGKAQAYIEEARLTVLELMGYLVSFYRNYSLGVRRTSVRDRSASGT